MSKKKWIQGAIKHPGALTRKAKKSHMTAEMFARHVAAHPEEYPASTRRQAALAKTLAKMRKKKKGK